MRLLLKLVGLVVVVFTLSPLSHANSIQAVATQSDAIIDEFQTELQSTLKAAIKEDGLNGGIEVCASKAPLIASELSRKHGVKLQRVSNKTRNSINTPDPLQAQLLNYLESNTYNSDSVLQERGEQAIYMKSINTEGVCLACHGSSIATEVEQTIKQNYPYDLATGYQLGDMRGAFSLTWNRPDFANSGIKNLSKASDDIWTAGQPSPEQLANLKQSGFKTVINLRPAQELTFDERSIVEKQGVSYQTLDIAGANDITYANSQKLRAMLEKAEKPVLLHCSSSNRVGGLLALDAKQQGFSDQQALVIGQATGMTRLTPLVQAKLKEQAK